MAGGDKLDETAALAARIALGGLAGAAALTALAITLRRARARRRTPAGAFDPSPRVADAVAATGIGALLAASHPAPSRIEGALAGSGWWLAGHMGWLPAAAIGPARISGEGRPSEMLVAYVAWGWAFAAELKGREAARINRPSD